ncbi:hypothetical protein Patl1_05745 [Pistacia atlantica]|uniref:Uncharacterized protein n=1 Tax=Pistacia atlantica TaxID=434234 RepID=A0ACC1BTT9_9ROSI|nr:hypothetical protein Patl1_05745 [Pistacia atlantica]
MYKTHPTVSGEVIEVYQPSQEEHQMTYSNLHNIKTCAKMNLLSMCDVLVTSSWSTFGNVAQGLVGLKPWILYEIGDKMPQLYLVLRFDPWSMITTSHDNCNAKTKGNPGFLLPDL